MTIKYVNQKKLCFLLIFLAFLSSYGQTVTSVDSTEVISLSFENTSIKNVLESIEVATNYKFFYVDSWFSDKLVSGSYTSVHTAKILEDIFKETDLNFYVLNKQKIILSKNNIIYDQLPNTFFKEDKVISDTEETVITPQSITPVFYSSNKDPGTTKLETVRIGKANLDNAKQQFVLQGYVRKNNGEPIPDL
ncbi:MAG: TonB-dependent receptor, partial [Eudoraea sp.]|nr:TonB-dependent receptor [Eudoraea sp.]